jgi:LPXTG-motif cell wall-anchored protein
VIETGSGADGLPITGVDVVSIAGFGLGLAVIGVLLMVLGRRRRDHAAGSAGSSRE